MSESEMRQYIDKIIEENSDDLDSIAGIKEAQKAWLKYRETHCSSVYTFFRGGTIRNIMNVVCKIKLTKHRTHELWFDFLTPLSGDEPSLPEPTLFE